MPGCVVAWKPLGLHLRPDSGWPDDIFDLDLGDIVFQFQSLSQKFQACYLFTCVGTRLFGGSVADGVVSQYCSLSSPVPIHFFKSAP